MKNAHGEGNCELVLRFKRRLGLCTCAGRLSTSESSTVESRWMETRNKRRHREEFSLVPWRDVTFARSSKQGQARCFVGFTRSEMASLRSTSRRRANGKVVYRSHVGTCTGESGNPALTETRYIHSWPPSRQAVRFRNTSGSVDHRHEMKRGVGSVC